MLLFVFFAVVTNLSVFWCSLSVGRADPNDRLFENRKLTAECFNKDPNECLLQLATYKTVKKLHLIGFIFDEGSIKQFSQTICGMKLLELTLDSCDINDELISPLVPPSGLKSIRFERLNLSSNGIQSIIDKLAPPPVFVPIKSPMLESIEVADWSISKCSKKKLSISLFSQKVSLDFSKFRYLKNICLCNLDENFDSYHLLLSLKSLSLERIKLSRVYLRKIEWIFLLKKWKNPNGIAFFKTLKEFNIEIEKIDESPLIQLIQFLFSIPSLEIISLGFDNRIEGISLPPLPSNIKQFSIPLASAFMEDGETPFYSLNNFSKLTHLTMSDSYLRFSFDLFTLNQLEYLKIDNNISSDSLLVGNQCCSKLKYLSINFRYLIPLLRNFNKNFPAIEALGISYVSSDDLTPHLKTIISKETLKFLEINFSYYTSYPVSVDIEDKSFIEELKLTNVYWEFVSSLLKVKQFPYLKKIYIETRNENVNLNDFFKKLSNFPLLTSLTLKGKFSFSYEQLPVTIANLKFFYLEISQEILDLYCLLQFMPNLIEFQLKGGSLKDFRLKNTVGIRYLTFIEITLNRNGGLVNVVKYIPNLIQFRNKLRKSPIQNISFAPELAYYLKKLKEHFNNKLQFHINPNCLPIKQLMNNSELLRLVRLKSPKLQDYLKDIFPIDLFKSFVKQLFTIEIGKYFSDKLINAELIKGFFSLLMELEAKSKEDVLLAQKLYFEGKNEYFTESFNFSLDNFYKLFSNYLSKNIGVNFESVHLEFIIEFYKANKKYGPFKIYNFLKSFFISCSVVDRESKINNFLGSFSPSLSIPGGQRKNINNEVFNFFFEPLLTSFGPLFDRIKENKLSEEEKKIIPFDYNPLAEDLRKLEPEEYKQLLINFKEILIDACNESVIKSFLDILKIAPTLKEECTICLNYLFIRESKYFESEDGNCHSFHRDCLDEWLKKRKTCPNCRRCLKFSN